MTDQAPADPSIPASGPQMAPPVPPTPPVAPQVERTPNPVALGAPAPAGRNAAIPWVLVALLSAVVLVLVTVMAMKGGLPTAGESPSASTPTAASAPATPDAAAVALMRSLPRRQADDPTALGAVDAPVVMIVWSDYRCPFCARWATTTFEELKPYVASGSLRVEARDLVLFGEESTLAAVAARAAGAQGKFWEFHDAIFAAAPTDGGHPTITTEDVVAFAKQAGVPDLARFRKDLTSKSLAAAVAADTDEARQLGISGTPFFLIDTTAINGAQPTGAFVQAIEAAGGHR